MLFALLYIAMSIQVHKITKKKIVTIDTTVTKNISPIYFMNDSRELFVCTTVDKVEGETWSVVAVRDCKLDPGVTLDDVANGIVQMNRHIFSN
jgi:hypothetical protein